MAISESAFIKVHGFSDIGKVRKLNEDKFSITNLDTKNSLNSYEGEVKKEGCLMLVCDGSGGDGRGEIAAKLAIDIFLKEIFSEDKEEMHVGERLIDAANKANEIIWKCSNSNPSIAGMASTLTAALVLPPLVYILEVGDSRCYLVREGTIRQVTKDQSMVQILLDGGVITPDTAKSHPYRNIVLQSLGAKFSVAPVITSLELAQKDILLLCSDGLSKNLPEETMLEILTSQEDVVIASQSLINAANELTADDNVTAIVAIVEGDAFAKAEASATLLLSETTDGIDFSDELEDLTSVISPIN
ncbi:MAG: serine/threonine-protein phosphatase [Acidobacteria bacterium]|nr:serine/threonine-protein phosphatase [Acidobacteriota bacterium]